MVLAYFAPGNIYAERGTLSFFWRSREPIAHTPFHIFQISCCDHSSIDMALMHIDYNSLPAPVRDGAVRSGNTVQEMPTGEFSIFRIAPGPIPKGPRSSPPP